MAVAFGTLGSVSSGASVTTLTPVIPSVSAGDGLFAHVIAQIGGTTINTPSGWTQIFQNNSGGTFDCALFYKEATGSDANPVFTWTGTSHGFSVIAKFTGCASAIIGTSSAASTGSADPHTSASFNSTAASSLAVAFDFVKHGSAQATPTGWTQAAISIQPTISLALWTKALGASGSASGAISDTTGVGPYAWTEIQVELLAATASTVALTAAATVRAFGTSAFSGRLPVTARSAGVGPGRVGGIFALAFRATAPSSAKGTTSFSGRVPLGGRSQRVSIGQAAFSGKVPLAARSMRVAGGRAGLSTVLALSIFARSGVMATGRAATTVTATLKSAGKSAVGIVSNSITGRVPLAASGKSVITARVVGSFSIALGTLGSASSLGLASPVVKAALRAASKSAGSAAAAFTGRVGLQASGVAAGMGRALGAANAALRASSAATGLGRLAGTFKAALQTAAASAGSGRLDGFTGKLSLAARSSAVGVGRVTVSVATAVFLVANSAARGTGRAAASGMLALRAVGKSAGVSTAQFSGAINLKAFGIGLGAGRVPSVVRASLQAVTAAASTARASSIGKVSLAAKTAARALSTAPISTLMAGFLALFASSGARGSGRAGSSGILGLTARGGTRALSRLSIGGAIGLQARTTAAAFGRASAAFTAGLKTVSKVVGLGRLDGFSGSVALSMRSASASKSGVIATVIAGLRASAMATAAGRAFGTFSAGLRAATRAGGVSKAGLAGAVSLASRAMGVSKARGLAAFVAGLASRSSGHAAVQTQVTGILTLTTASSVKSTGSAAPSLFVPFTALSAFGRSVANSLALLIVKHPIFIDPDYVVEYPAPNYMVGYPLPARIVYYQPMIPPQ